MGVHPFQLTDGRPDRNGEPRDQSGSRGWRPAANRSCCHANRTAPTAPHVTMRNRSPRGYGALKAVRFRRRNRESLAKWKRCGGRTLQQAPQNTLGD